MSTWGRDSLFALLHDQSADLFRTFESGSTVLLAPHPHLWADYDIPDFLKYLQNRFFHLRFLVASGTETVRHFLVASDCAITDNTSLAIIYCTLGKPLFVYRPHRKWWRLDTRATISQLLVRVPAIRELPECFDPELARRSLYAVRAAAQQAWTYPGRSGERLMHILKSYLQLACS